VISWSRRRSSGYQLEQEKEFGLSVKSRERVQVVSWSTYGTVPTVHKYLPAYNKPQRSSSYLFYRKFKKSYFLSILYFLNNTCESYRYQVPTVPNYLPYEPVGM